MGTPITPCAAKFRADDEDGLQPLPQPRVSLPIPNELISNHPGELNGGGVLPFSEKLPDRIGMTATATQFVLLNFLETQCESSFKKWM